MNLKGQRWLTHISPWFLRWKHSLTLTQFCDVPKSQSGRWFFSVGFDKHRIIFDPFEQTHKLVLDVCDGVNRFHTLHEQLYQELDSSKLPIEPPFTPHITVGTHARKKVLSSLDPALIGDFPIVGEVRGLTLVDFKDGVLTIVRTMPFSG